MTDPFGGEPEAPPPNGRQPKSDSALFEERIADFEFAWNASNPPSIAEYLGPPVANRRALALELVLVDIELRAKAGLAFPLEVYQQISEGEEEFMEQVAAQIEKWRRDLGSLDRPVETKPTSEKLPDARNALPLDPDGNAKTLADEPTTAEGLEHIDLSFSGYELLGRIGEGGMGVVYRARQIALGRIVALKVLHHGELASKARRDRFKREAEILAKVDDPCVVKIHDANLERRFPYLTMEHLSGGSLASLLGKGPMSPKAAAELVARLARAMHSVHEQNVIHRDIKPSNILFNQAGEPRICDFGLAKDLDSDVTRTRDGGFLGTPTYMAPEQIDPQIGELGPATDVHALGNILYECLTGRPPHAGIDNLVLLERIRSTPPRPIRSIDRRLPKDLQAVCERCLHKKPSHRYQSSKQLAEDLERYLDGQGVRARPVSTFERAWGWARRNKAASSTIALASLLALLVPLALVYHFHSIRKNEADLLAEATRIKQTNHLQDDIKNAHDSWKKGRPQLLQSLFEKYSEKDLPDSFEFPWAYLKTLRDEFEKGSVQAHAGAVSALWVDPAAGRVFTGGADGFIRVWQPDSVRPIFEWKAGEQGVKTIGAMKGARVLFTRHYDNSIRFWSDDNRFGSLGDNHIVWPAKGKLSAVSPDGSFTIYADGIPRPNIVVRCDAKTGAELGRIPTGNDMPIELLSFLGDSSVYLAKYSEFLAAYEPGKPDPKWTQFLDSLMTFNSTANGRWIAAASGTQAVVLNPDSAELHHLRSRDAKVPAVACSEDGLSLVSGGEDGIIDCWQLAPKQRLVGSFRGHLSTVTAAAFLPGSRTIVTADVEGRLKFTDISRPQDFERLRPRDPFAGPIALLPGGREAVGFDARNQLALLDTRNGKVYSRLSGHTKDVVSFRVSPDGSTAASASLDQTVRLWSIERETVKSSRIVWSGEARHLRYNHKGKLLALGCVDGNIRFLELPKGDLVKTLPNVGAPAGDFAFTDDDSRLAAAGPGNVVQVFDLIGNAPLERLDLPAAPISLAWSHDGKALAIGLAGPKIEIWDWQGRKRLAEHRPTQHSGPGNPTTNIFFDPADAQVVSIHTGNQAYAWFRDTGVIAWTIAGPNDSNLWLDVAPDLSSFAMVNGDGGVYLCDSSAKLRYTRQPGHPPGPIRGIAFLPDGNLVTCSRDRVVHFRDGLDPNKPDLENRLLVESTNRSILKWNIDTGAEEPYVAANGPRTEVFEAMAASPVGDKLAFKTWGGGVEVFDASSGIKLLHLFHTKDNAKDWTKWETKVSEHNGRDPSFDEGNGALTFSHDANLLASLAPDHSVVMWELAGGKQLAIPQFKGTASSIAFSPKDSLIAIGEGKAIQVWNHKLLKRVQNIEGFSDDARAILFSPDGESLAVAHKPSGLTIVPLKGTKERIDLVGGEKPVVCFAFSRDGTLIAAACEDGKALVWMLDKSESAGAASISAVLELDLPEMLPRAIAFTSKGDVLACAGELRSGGGDVYLFKTKRNK